MLDTVQCSIIRMDFGIPNAHQSTCLPAYILLTMPVADFYLNWFLHSGDSSALDNEFTFM